MLLAYRLELLRVPASRELIALMRAREPGDEGFDIFSSADEPSEVKMMSRSMGSIDRSPTVSPDAIPGNATVSRIQLAEQAESLEYLRCRRDPEIPAHIECTRR